MEILKVENLTKVYGKGENEVRALNGVSFSVEKGDFVAIIGPSGSGKSTLLHTLGGVDRPTGGKVLVNGQDVYSRSDEQIAVFRRREVGLIYQFYNLIPVLNVEENMSLPVLLDGRNVNRDRLRELIRELDLVGREKHLPNQLSGGQQQRVSIGRALMNSPSIVLADEPTGNLDSATGKEIFELLKKVSEKRLVVVVTHDREAANKYGERVKVYTMGTFSKEICGGPHAGNTGDLGHFKIKKEEASSSGVRRIKAVLEY